MKNKMISVIVPVYKVEQYLDKCVQSLIGQTYKDLEIILVDDGSPDNCGKLCDQYAIKDKRIKVIHKNNGGLSDARNVGIKYASGDYIGFVDSDDYIDMTFYEYLMSLISQYDADIAECYSVSFLDGDIPKAKHYDATKTKILNAKEWITETDLGEFLSCVAWNKIYKKQLFIDIEYPVGRHYEDDSTTYKLIYKANKIVRGRSELYFYRQRQNSITNEKKDIKELEQQFLALYEKCSYFEELNEQELVDFSYGRLLIFLLSTYSIWGKEDFEMKSDWTAIIKNKKSVLNKSSAVPFKHKLYINIKSLLIHG